MKTSCSAPKCSSNAICRKDLSFFSFPLDPERCKQWIANCHRRDLLDKDVSFVHKNNKLCSLHFNPEMCIKGINRTLLTKNAVPTIFDTSCKVQEDDKGTAPKWPKEKEVFILPKPSPSANTPAVFLASDSTVPVESTVENSLTANENLPASDFVNLVSDSVEPTFQLPPMESSDSTLEPTSQYDENVEESVNEEFDPSDYIYPVYMEPDSPNQTVEPLSHSYSAADSSEVLISSLSAGKSTEISSLTHEENSQQSCSSVKSSTATNEDETMNVKISQDCCRCELLSRANKLLVNDLEEKTNLLERKDAIIKLLQSSRPQPSLNETFIQSGDKDSIINYLQLEVIQLRKELALVKSKYKGKYVAVRTRVRRKKSTSVNVE